MDVPAAPRRTSAVLLDRDGTINRERRDYVRSWADFEFLPGTLCALRLLATTPFAIVVVTNQSVVGRGLAPRTAVDDVHEEMARQVLAKGGRVDGVFVCPHRPDDACRCRKPRSANVAAALRHVGADPAASVFVGDSATDVVAGAAAGVRPVLLARCDEIHNDGGIAVAPNLLAVARAIATAWADGRAASAADAVVMALRGP